MQDLLLYYVRWFAIVCPLMFCTDATAEAVDKYWGAMQKEYFPGKVLQPSTIVHLTAPQRADSGEQVPFAFDIDYPTSADKFIKNVSIFVDANPVPLAAIFHFTANGAKAEISTRIRLESDSFVHVVAEASDGMFYMNGIPIRASGGCGGAIDGDESAARTDAGKMKLAVEKPVTMGRLNHINLLIKHPMYTGLQRDLVSQGFRPAFFINKIEAKYNGVPIMQADIFIGISENPNLRFGLVADAPGTFEVTIQDNEGKTFTKSIEVKDQ